MEVPTPPNLHPALRPTEPYSRKADRSSTDSYGKDKKVLINWALGVVGSAALAGIGWTSTHVLAAENVNGQQALQIQSLDKRAEEDRAVIRDQFKQQSDKLDRLLERMK